MPFTSKSSLMLLEFSSKGDSYQSAATYSLGPCVGVRLDIPRLSASEVTFRCYVVHLL